MAQQIRDIENVIEGLGRLGYVADRALATAVYLLLKLEKPLLIEGHAGGGKTEAAKALAAMLETDLIRLQCYEGLDLNSAVYEWNYQKQLLAIKIQEGSDKTVVPVVVIGSTAFGQIKLNASGSCSLRSSWAASSACYGSSQETWHST